MQDEEEVSVALDLIDIIIKILKTSVNVTKIFHIIKEKVQDIVMIGNVQEHVEPKEIFMVNKNYWVDGFNRTVPVVPVINDAKNVEEKSFKVKGD